MHHVSDQLSDCMFLYISLCLMNNIRTFEQAISRQRFGNRSTMPNFEHLWRWISSAFGHQVASLSSSCFYCFIRSLKYAAGKWNKDLLSGLNIKQRTRKWMICDCSFDRSIKLKWSSIELLTTPPPPKKTHWWSRFRRLQVSICKLKSISRVGTDQIR